MGADDDDDLGDESLKSLRAVWLAMPDEEPSDRGMSALLAAATLKAKEMAPPPAEAEASWFAKLLDVFRRPPVLALATVVVLVGGAVLVNRHEDQVKHEAAAPAIETDKDARATAELGRGGAPVAPADTGWTYERAGGAGSAPPATETTGKERKATAAPKVEREATKRDPKPSAPAKSDAKAGATIAAPTTEAPATSDEMVGSPPPPPPTEDAPSTESTTRAPAPKPTATATPPRNGQAGGAPQQNAQPTKPTLTAEQLLTQCQSAAVRGDCVATRDLAGRIQKASATLYRDKVLRDDRITRCLSHDTSTLAH